MNAIELKDISVIYGENTPFRKAALNNINVEFPKGMTTGIIGHTGSGKSTLASLLNGLLTPTSGKVLLGGRDIWEKPKEMVKIRSRVGLVFQYPEYQLFDETVEADIAFGPKNIKLSDAEIKERVALAARFCGLSERELKRSPFELSGGQKRRAAIAGVLAMRPEVLVLDEPAAGLDPRGREEILGGLQEYKNTYGATLIIISHSMEDIAKYADRILVMKNGEVYMQGTTEEIFMQAEKLFDADLDLPQITKLFIELKKRGICESSDVYTVKYAKNMLEKILGINNA
ncbi:MAG: energy-coupling factor transporter ATPase [Ruminococcaceae bacterium]|nr:energy-coupling factor transporter ATPase [Oscillospiraceae bacterium]